MSQTKNAVLLTIREMARNRSKAVALRFVGDELFQEVNFVALQENIQARLDCFKRIGLQAGDRVVLWGSNSPEWMYSYLALAQLEATSVPLDGKLTKEQFIELLQRVEAQALVVDAEHHAQSPDVDPDTLRLRMENGSVIGGAYPDKIAGDAVRPDDLDPSLGVIMFTSGSTADPKGVMLSRASVAHATDGVAQRFGLSESSELLCVLPFQHVLGLGTSLATLQAGGCVTLLQETRGDLLVKAMNMTHTTVMPGPPRLFELLFTNIQSQIAQMPAPLRGMIRGMRVVTRLIRSRSAWNPGKIVFRKIHKHFGGALELFVSGGASLPGEVRKGLEEFGFNIVEGYGLTETAGTVSINTLEQNRGGTVGRPFPDIEVVIANQDIDGEGEICVRGPSIMRGYFHDRKATDESFRDGAWLRTGDVGNIGRDGFITITGRIKELIVTSAGKNVAPEAVELQYRGIEGLKDLVVLGMPSSTRHGEEVHAAIVPQSHDPEQEQRIQEVIAARSAKVPSYLHIQRVHVMREIPRTSSHKVRRTVLRQMLLEKSAAIFPDRSVREQNERDEVSMKVIHIARSLVSSHEVAMAIGPESALVFDIGLDSLAMIEFASSLRHEFQVGIDNTALQARKTIADVAQLIQQLLHQSSNPEQQAAKKTLRSLEIPPPGSTRSLLFLRAIQYAFVWLWKLEVDGLSHLPGKGPFILCPNHESHLDVFFVAACLPRKYQQTFCTFAKSELFDGWFTHSVARLVRAVPVDQRGDPTQVLKLGVEMLKAGRPVFIHPEGARTRDGMLQPFRRGVAHLALQTGVPLIPIHIDGAFEIYPPDARFPKLFSLRDEKPLRLRIRFGEPFLPPQDTHDAEAERELTEALRRKIEDLGKGN